MLFFDDKSDEDLKIINDDEEEDYEKVNTIFSEQEEEIEDDEDEFIPQNKVDYIVESKIIDAPTNGLYPQEIRKEMKNSFLEYAMSVIVSRALPDVRDGLKPVHRRILFGMNELGITHSSAHKKSARIVGDVLGKYHPHGDSSVYEAMVRLAQDFSLRYPLVDGHGNFGSIDGDPAAAMRYTEARMSKIASQMLDGINKNTVDFIPNYDASEQEPITLPSRFPNILIMGATGIAVGMATSIPPHNLRETIEATQQLAKNPDISIEDLMNYIKGPDFPIGAEILGTKGIEDTYLTGRGTISIRSKSQIETSASGKSKIIISQIPYEIKKITIIEKIAELVKFKAIDGISDLRDESNKDGIRIVISIKKNFDPVIVLNHLYRQTPLQTNYNANMVALVDGEPKLLNLKQMLEVYLQHQYDVVARRVKFDLEKAQYRLLILEGLKIAVDNIDKVIKIIKSSSNDTNAIERLSSTFNLIEIQAKAIVDMRLGRLTNLAIEKMNEEIAILESEISKYQAILSSRELLTNLIVEELEEIKNKYGDERRTIINQNAAISISDEDLIKQRDIVISISSNGYVKRTDLSEYRIQKRGGVGIQGMKMYEGNDLSQLIVTSSHIDLLLFSSLGKIYRIRALQIPDQGRQSKGLPFINLIDLGPDEKIVSIIATDSYKEDEYLITVTKMGIIKKTSIKNFVRINSNGKKALGLKWDDELVRAMIVKENESIIIASSSGHVVKFNISSIRDMSRISIGVIAIKLENGFQVISASHSAEGQMILSMSALGFAKLTSSDQYRETKRGARGVLAMNIKKAGELIGCSFVNKDDELFLVNNNNVTLRTSISQLPNVGRSAKGVKAIKLKDGELLKSYSIINNKEIQE